MADSALTAFLKLLVDMEYHNIKGTMKQFREQLIADSLRGDKPARFKEDFKVSARS
jgi:hypothetical protein